MDFNSIKGLFTEAHFLELLDHYRGFGPLIGISLPLIESFLPILPLVVLVLANTVAFGPLLGFFYSWLGSCLGSILLFYLVRKFGQKRFFNFLNKHPKASNAIKWIEKRGFGPIFLLFCFPFSPSFLINVVAGISRINIKQFIIALVLGKFTLIALISYFGKHITSIFHNPRKATFTIILIAVLWVVGKVIEKRMNFNEQTPSGTDQTQPSDE